MLGHAAAGVIMAAVCSFAVGDGMTADSGMLKLAGVHLEVTEQNAECFVATVSAKGVKRSHRLDIPAPCAFHKDKAGAIRTIRNGRYEYVLVESSKPVGAGTRDCETQLRSLRAAGGQLQVSQHKDKVASCPPFQWDRMVFTELFD